MTVIENFIATKNHLEATGAPAEMVDFIQSRIDLVTKSQEHTKAKRLEKNGGEKKDISNSEFYTSLRDAIYKVVSTTPATGDALIAASGFKSQSGKPVLAAQVATALKPLLEDGTIVTEDVKVEVVDKHGLKKETLRKGYRLA